LKTGDHWEVTKIEESWEAGKYNSMVLDSAGNPHISYYDHRNGILKYAFWAENQWQIQSIANTDDFHSSIALDAMNRPHFTYKGEDFLFTYTFWNGSAWESTVLNHDMYAGERSALAIDLQGNPLISFDRYLSSEQASFTRFDGAEWIDEVIESGYILDRLSMGNGLLNKQGHFSFVYGYESLDFENLQTIFELKLATRLEEGWQKESLALYGPNPRLAFDSQGNAHIVVDEEENGFQYAAFDGQDWHITKLSSSNHDASYAFGFDLDGQNQPHLGYVNRDQSAVEHLFFDGRQWQREVVFSLPH
jgi:hypothetical protein